MRYIVEKTSYFGTKYKFLEGESASDLVKTADMMEQWIKASLSWATELGFCVKLIYEDSPTFRLVATYQVGNDIVKFKVFKLAEI